MRIRIDDIELYVERAGSGPPLLLLHGFTGSADEWAGLIPRLTGLREVIAPDLIGHGRSSAPADPARYTMEQCVVDLLALLDSLGHERVELLGYSMGGRVALQLAAAAPGRVRSLILESASPGIEDEAERQRLREATASFIQPDQTGGFIVRTAAEGATPEALRADMVFLQKLWALLTAKAATTRAGNLVYEDLPLAVRVLRDVVSSGVDRVSVDHPETHAKMQEFARTFMPDMVDRIELYTGERPIFDLHGVEEEIQKSLDRKVPLKSGGYLIFDQTEAMTTIDVNTGAYVGHRNLEETIFRTNLEASVAIARQLRLRNLGGIIIIDFIDMAEEEHRRQVLQSLERALMNDHAKTHISSVSPLGLVEMTRKRTRESLEHMLCMPCPTCEGRGFVKTSETVCYEIFREILRQSRQFQFQELMVLAHQDVIERLLDEESAALAELEVHTGKPIRLQTEALYQQDQYDVVLM